MRTDRIAGAVLLAAAGSLGAQAPPGDVAVDPVIELSEAVLDAYAASDWSRLQGYFGGDAPDGEAIGLAVGQHDRIIGRPEQILLYETESGADGCSLRRYAVRFENGSGRLEMSLCPNGEAWELDSFGVTPDTIFVAEYLLTDILPKQTGVEIMFAHCGGDGGPEAVGELPCVAITTDGETLSIDMKVAEPGQVQIVGATVSAEAPPDATRAVLEPVVRELLDRYDRGAAGEILDRATPGFQQTVELAYLEQVLDDIHQVLGPVRGAEWVSQTSDAEDGLPIVRMAVRFEEIEGEAVVKLVPFEAGWAVHRFEMIPPLGSVADRMLTERALLRIVRQLTLDSSATIDCAVDRLARRGSSVACTAATHGRVVEARADRSEGRYLSGEDELEIVIDDLQIGLGHWLVELERPLRWRARSLTCSSGALAPGKTTTCVARHDDGSTRLQVRVTAEGRIRIVAAEELP